MNNRLYCIIETKRADRESSGNQTALSGWSVVIGKINTFQLFKVFKKGIFLLKV